MHKELCGGRSGLCDAMRPTRGADLLKYLRKVEFKGIYLYLKFVLYKIIDFIQKTKNFLYTQDLVVIDFCLMLMVMVQHVII